MIVPQPYRWLAFWVALIALCMVVFVQPATAEALRDKVNALAIGKFKARAVAIEALGKMPDPRVAPILQALGQGQLYFRKTDKQVVIANKVSGGFELADPLSLEALGKVGRRDIKKIKVK